MSKSSAVRTWEEALVLPTYLPAPPDRNPMFLEKRVYQGSSGRVYPLPVTDRIAEQPVLRLWRAIWIENAYLRVLLLPELGGRIHALLDKTNGYDLIYRQPVIKPALVGLAGPWISGGIEFNWPQHHRPATFLPVETTVQKHRDGSVTVWCSDHDPLARMKGMHGVCLYPDRAYLELKVRAHNRTPLVQTFLWWANVATRVHEGYQSFFPPDVTCVADHARRSMSTYPLASGHYYGVDYGARGRSGIPASEVPRQYVPPHGRRKSPRRPSPLPGHASAMEKRRSSIPDYAANDLSFYANIPVPTSYMCVGSQQDFFGGYDHRAQAGIVHLASHHIAPGKKQWTWGNHEFGYAWDRNLTDPDPCGEHAPYIEIMAGVYTDNQPDFAFLGPGETKVWNQYWYPIQQIGPVQQANRNGALSLRLDGARGQVSVRLGVAVTQPFPKARVRLLVRGAVVFRKQRALVPGQPLLLESPLPQGTQATDLHVQVTDETGAELLAYQPQAARRPSVPPPATEPPAPAAIATTDELFVTGLHLEQYRHATRCPTLYWREALRRDPLDSRCNNALGLWHLRRGEFTAAEARFRRAIERLTRRNANPYDGEPFYNLGVTLRYRTSNLRASSYAAFYKATWNQAWAGPASHALAELDCHNGDWAKALAHLQTARRLDSENLRARNLEVVALRALDRHREAARLLRGTLEFDPLDAWARFLDTGRFSGDLQCRLDVAHDYARAGLYREALALLDQVVVRSRPKAPALVAEPPSARPRVLHECESESGLRLSDLDPQLALPTQSWGATPLLHYTRGWLHLQLAATDGPGRVDRTSKPPVPASAARSQAAWHQRQALACLREAAAAPTDYCFPARLEEIAVLEAAIGANPEDARAPYYLGNLLYDRRRHDEAIGLWERSARLDPSFAIVWRNLGLGYFNVRGQPAKARAAYDHAIRANPADARLLYERDQLWKRLGIGPARRLRALEAHPTLVRQRDDLSLALCTLYHQTGHPAKAIEVIRHRRFQPWEGGEGGPLGQHVRSRLALGRQELAEGDLAQARAHFEAALTAPPELGEARHLLANQSEVHYWLGCALAALGERAEARRHWRAAATFRGDFQELRVRTFSEMTYYSALAWERLGRRKQAQSLLESLFAYGRQLEAEPARVDYFATSLPDLLLFEEDLQRRQETQARVLQAQAHLGLGREREAITLLKRILRTDPSHPVAADMLRDVGNRV